jgi:hypothetical protein
MINMVNKNNNLNLYQLQKLKDLLKNNNTAIKKSIIQGAIISSITIISYLLIVVFTSPNLPAIMLFSIHTSSMRIQ